MAACDLRTQIRNGIFSNVQQSLLDSKLFLQINENVFSPISPDSNYQEIVNDINSQYDSQVLGKTTNIAPVKTGVSYQLNNGESLEHRIASEKTIRDLAARMSHRIGIPVRFESDRTKNYKGKIEDNKAYINLAYATLDTPVHEILGHPIIRAIRGKIETVKPEFTTYKMEISGGIAVKINGITSGSFKTQEEADKFIEFKKQEFDNLNKGSKLYQNLLKELEYGKGKEVLDRIKRDYQYKERVFNLTPHEQFHKSNNEFNAVIEYAKKNGLYNTDQFDPSYFVDNSDVFEVNNNKYKIKYGNLLKIEPYPLEEQQEEAVVELLGMMTADKLDAVKDGKLISLLKRLLKEIKSFVRSLLNQKEIEIDKLPDNLTLNDLANILAYSNSKLILPGNEVVYTTPDNQQFKTYQETSNHISELTKNVKDVDLNGINLDINKNNNPYNLVPDKPYYTSDSNFLVFVNSDKIIHYRDFPGYKDLEKGNYYEYKFISSKYRYEFVKITTAKVQELVDNNPGLYIGASDELKNADLDKIGIRNFVEKNKEYEQSKEIIEEWKKVNNIQYDPEEVYSRGQEFVSVVGAYSDFDVNLMMQNLLSHMEDNEKAGGQFSISAFTKPIGKIIDHLEGGGGKIKFKIFPQSKDILWAANTDVFSGSVWDASEKVNKDKKSELLGVSYTKYPYLGKINSVSPNLADIIDNLSHHHNELGIVLTGNNFRLEYDEDVPYSTKKIINSINSILDQKYGKIEIPEITNKGKFIKKYQLADDYRADGETEILRIFNTLEEAKQAAYELNRKGGYLDSEFGMRYSYKEVIQKAGKQPTQTNETLKTKISDIKYDKNTRRPKTFEELEEGDLYLYREEGGKYFKENLSSQEDIEITKEEYEGRKKYTSQALINIKIAALKEVAIKYPRSLIRSEVRPIQGRKINQFEDDDMLPFQKIPSKPGVQRVFIENPELASIGSQEQYSAYLDTIFPDSQVKDIVYHGTNEPIEGDKFSKKPGATGNGIWFTGSRRYAKINMDRAQPSESLIGRPLRGEPTLYSVLLNIENPKNFYNSSGALLVQTPSKFEEQYNRKVNDAALFHHPNSKKPETSDSADQIVVFEPEQIHILGSKQDVEGFKEFVNNSDSYTITISEELIDTYEKKSEETNIEIIPPLPGNPNEVQLYPQSQEQIMEELGYTDVDSFITNEMKQHLPIIDKVRAANNSFQIEFGEDYSQFDPNTNKVFISLPELKAISVRENIPLSQVVEAMILHELGHAATFYALDKNPKLRNNLQQLMDIAVSHHKNIPFVDYLRQGYVRGTTPYAFTNLDEFVADFFGNPYFISYLKSIPSTEGRNLFQRIIDAILEFFGISKPSLYDSILELVTSQEFQADNQYGVDNQQGKYPIELIYRGQPKNYYQAAYDLFTKDIIEEEVAKIFKDIPKIFIKLKQELSQESHVEKRKKIQSLLDAYYNIQDKEDAIKTYINMLTQASYIAKDIQYQLLQVPKQETNAKKIALAYSLKKNAEGLSFLQPVINNVVSLIKREGVSPNIAAFVNQLNDVTSIIISTNQAYLELTREPLISLMIETAGESEYQVSTENRIKDLKSQLKTAPKNEIPFIEGQIKNLEAQLKLIANKVNITSIMNGMYPDASSMQLNFEAGLANGHPVVQIVESVLKTNNIRVSQLMLNQANDYQKKLDNYKKDRGVTSIRKTDTFYQNLMEEVQLAQEVTSIEGGVPVYSYVTTKMLLSEYSPEYLKIMSEHNALVNYLFSQLHDKAIDQSDAQNQLNKAIQNRRKFVRENSLQNYKDPIYEMYDLLDTPIQKIDGTTTTLGQEKGYLFKELEILELRRNAEIIPTSLEKIQEQIKLLNIQIRELRSPYNEGGSEKTGFEKTLADLANKYTELRREYGSYELTPNGQALFEREVEALKQQVALGEITPRQYDERVANMVVTEATSEFQQLVKYYQDRISVLSEQLSNIPAFESIFSGVDSQSIRDNYEKLRQLTAAFRDGDQIIDGTLFTKIRPEVVPQIKKIQEDVEKLKNISEKLKGLSVSDSIRRTDLLNKQEEATITEEELEELTDLQNKLNQSNNLYNEHKELIDTYNEVLVEYSKLFDRSTSEYYQLELDHQIAILKQELIPNLQIEIKNSTSLLGGKYIKELGVWRRVIQEKQDGTKVVENIDTEGFSSVEEALLDEIATLIAERDVINTDWYRDNHYERYVWDVNKGYVPQQTPIYIWSISKPADSRFIAEFQPSFRYKTYKIKDNYINKDFKLLNDGIPYPKKDRFPNEKYKNLSPTDKEFLEFLRQNYHKDQELYPTGKEMGDILPSFPKTSDELKVQATESLKNKAGKLLRNVASIGFQKSNSLDESEVTGGSTPDYFAKNRVLPTRFTSKMDISRQSSDLPAMLLAFKLATLEFQQMEEDQPFLETLRDHVKNLPVTELRTSGIQSTVSSIFSAVKHGLNKKAVTKDTDQSILSRTVDHALDTRMYGFTKEASTINVGGVEIDMNKVSSNLKQFSSYSIFAFNLYAAVKNSVSAYIQANINSNIARGFFTRPQYNKSHAEAVSYLKDFWQDYKKFGNKTKIGQELDFFQILQGATYDEYGKKTAFTHIKNAGSYMTAPKNSSEFEIQVAQYLAMSKANPVKVNGEWVEFRKAYTLDQNNNLVLVPGAEVTQEQVDRFINKIAYVNRIINGAYRKEERNKFQKNILGDLAFYLNGYFIPAIVNRFSKTRYYKEADFVSKGYINETLQFTGALFKHGKNISKKWKYMSVEERNRVLRGYQEIGIIIGVIFLTMALGAGDDKEELKKNSALKNWALSLALGVKAETETFIPLPWLGLNDMARKANSPFAALRQITNIIKFVENLSLFIVQDEDAFYKQTYLKDGFHDKGDPKFIANFLKLVGWSGIGFDPVEKVLQVERAQQLR